MDNITRNVVRDFISTIRRRETEKSCNTSLARKRNMLHVPNQAPRESQTESSVTSLNLTKYYITYVIFTFVPQTEMLQS